MVDEAKKRIANLMFKDEQIVWSVNALYAVGACNVGPPSAGRKIIREALKTGGFVKVKGGWKLAFISERDFV